MAAVKSQLLALPEHLRGPCAQCRQVNARCSWKPDRATTGCKCACHNPGKGARRWQVLRYCENGWPTKDWYYYWTSPITLLRALRHLYVNFETKRFVRRHFLLRDMRTGQTYTFDKFVPPDIDSRGVA